MNSSDQELLREFSQSRSDAAFAELERRHAGRVFAVAWRVSGNRQTAEDVTQLVFVQLAKHARSLAEHPVLMGWLHRTARNLAANRVRSEVRRQVRERAVGDWRVDQQEDDVWQNIEPELDAAIDALRDGDREAVLLRYFENRSAREMAVCLGVSPEAAQKRVHRGVEKLRDHFRQKGVTLSSSALGEVILERGGVPLPRGWKHSLSTGKAGVGGGAQVVPWAALLMLGGVALWGHVRAKELGSERGRLVAVQSGGDGAGVPVRARDRASDQDRVEDPWREYLPIPGWISFHLGGRLTTAAVEELGLTEEEIDGVTEVFQHARLEAMRGFMERTQWLTSGPGEEAAHVTLFRVPALDDRGRSWMEGLDHSFAEVIGPPRAKKLMQGLCEQPVGNLAGRMEMNIEFGVRERGDRWVAVMTKDPGTGKILESFKGGVEDFELRYGQVIQFAEQP
ncbi:RNA polymerase sigma factor (sigma-70 family) [Haloferula luteola]|uniref:RNA polymerase sigma factor (Sigma-70 family) n=1 Tax=Haloferula luteola TaxID=595692 RepID=A0A840V658_9BACT|nr:sigma-70 family RNA polymerase sigma factor [Haloferula luteola]MBB5350268.1 RNA polymerase sigma factor (sigma-70 family) [Haloferula luteola]